MAIRTHPGRWTARGARQLPRRRQRVRRSASLDQAPNTGAFRGLVVGLVLMMAFWLAVIGATLLVIERVAGLPL